VNSRAWDSKRARSSADREEEEAETSLPLPLPLSFPFSGGMEEDSIVGESGIRIVDDDDDSAGTCNIVDILVGVCGVPCIPFSPSAESLPAAAEEAANES
jgi:hypothetical protein